VGEWNRERQRLDDFVASDLVRAIDARFRTIPDGHSRVIGGFSEGAYGALNIALHNVGVFDTVESWSGYMQALKRFSGRAHKSASRTVP
jgi:S-formylglutathione hydrolase FrmB